MIIANKQYWYALAAVAVLQTGVLAKIAFGRVALIKHGREIVLPVQPVDPRDLFRGDYVILGYDLTSVAVAPTDDVEKLAALKRGALVYVRVHPEADGSWSPQGLSVSFPAKADPQDVVLKARVTYNPLVPMIITGKGPKISVRYGIESYFVPEGTGRKLEASVREKKIQAIVAVGADGTAALKGLVIDGERHEDPPLL